MKRVDSRMGELFRHLRPPPRWRVPSRSGSILSKKLPHQLASDAPWP